MAETLIRPARIEDLPRLTEIYNHYVIHTTITFDLEPYTVESRADWFHQFAPTGRYRLLVAEQSSVILGYAGTTRFRAKPAYDPTVEAMIYCAPEAVGRGIGRRLFYSSVSRNRTRRHSSNRRRVHDTERGFCLSARKVWVSRSWRIS